MLQAIMSALVVAVPIADQGTNSHYLTLTARAHQDKIIKTITIGMSSASRDRLDTSRSMQKVRQDSY